MSSLANLPEVIGFFSYSREDDEAFRGTLSALRDAIQRELGAQLGRSKRNFRLWQDQEAISPGKLWESEIKTAVEQSVFFIPIVTPRVVNSEYCQFEFESFLARERTLGRADLVFPILYISVPALEDEAQWRNHPVLSAIAKRQYVDWRSMRHLDIQSTVVREAIERFCNKIVEALQQSWQSPEERKRREDAEAQTRAEEERRRQEVETKRRAEEDARRRHDEAEARRIADERRQQEAETKRRADEERRQAQTEAEARQRAEQERRGREAEAKQRADQERAFAAAKAADIVSAIDKFLSTYPDSHLAGEAKALRTTLVERDDAYKEAIGSDDPAVLKAFLERYPAGKPSDAVRKRARRLEGQSRPSRRAILVGGGALGVGGLGAAAVIASRRSRVTFPAVPAPSPFLIRTLTATTLPLSVAIAPDGRTALSGGLDLSRQEVGAFTLWDLASGSAIRSYTGHSGSVNSVAIAPDGRTALSGSYDKTLKLWDLTAGSIIHTLTGHTETVYSVAIAPDGRTGLSGSEDKTLRLWNLASGSLIRTLTGHTETVLSVAIAPDGRTGLSGSVDKTLRLWNLASGSLIRTLTGHTETVHSVAIAPDGRTALSGSFDKTLKLWDLTAGSTIRTLTGHTEELHSVAIAPDGRTGLSGSEDKTLRLWDLTTGSTIRTFTGHTDLVYSVAIAPDGRTALSGSQDRTLKLWDLT
jgi:hypothetical protein